MLAAIARVAILVLAGSMALRETGVGDQIVNMAFGLSMFGIALAAGLAFGLGSREAAGRAVERWSRTLRGDRTSGDEGGRV
jgi:hypothetical protein